MELIKKTIGKFFYAEMLWIIVPFMFTVVPFENTSKYVFPVKSEIHTDIKNDLKFIINASESGLMEMKLGALVQNNGLSAEVIKFGKIMIEDHSKANKELSVLANKNQIAIPEILNKKQQGKYNRLAKKTGVDFDKIYISCMISDHKKDISAFEKEAKKGTNLEIKNWAFNKIPVLKHHLRLAIEADASLKNIE